MSFARVVIPAPLFPLDRSFDFIVPQNLRQSVQLGSWVEVPLGHRRSWGVVASLTESSEVPEKKLREILSVKLPFPLWDAKRMNWLNWLSRHYAYPLGEVFEGALPGPLRSAKESSLKKALVELEDVRPHFETTPGPHTLNDDQSQAVERICAGTKPLLLWGLTGSGKTEVYLESLRRLLNSDLTASALVLVPEIALTPQLLHRFEERFPNQVAHFHSGLSDKTLRTHWLSVWGKKKRIAVGARSALFAPLPNLKIVVIDEEHDASYKQEERLRYHARDAALALASIAQAKIVLGSATPSIESWWAVKNKKFELAKLEKRAVSGASLPRVEVVSLKESPQFKIPEGEPLSSPDPRDLLPGSTKLFFSDPLIRELDRCLTSGNQAILFLNRRGVGSQSLCSTCHHVQDCPNCSVTLTPHKKTLLCHYCGFELRSQDPCRNCGTPDSQVEVGLGTEQVESAIQILFPRARTLRMDRDTVDSSANLAEVLNKFKLGEAEVLIGTQMVAKGHDFPRVSFVGILFAELGLSIPDFRATERNFQLLLQVAGRAGRGNQKGCVVVQSFQPNTPSIQALKHQDSLEDYASFLSQELENREALLYPPFGRLALIRLDSNGEGFAERAAHRVANGLRRLKRDSLTVLGPTPSPLYKLRGRYRFQVLLKSKTASDLQTALHWLQGQWRERKLETQMKTRLILDVDPVQML